MGAVIRYGFITEYLRALFHAASPYIDEQIAVRVAPAGRHHRITRSGIKKGGKVSQRPGGAYRCFGFGFHKNWFLTIGFYY
jgi:hypothetical protein